MRFFFFLGFTLACSSGQPVCNMMCVSNDMLITSTSANIALADDSCGQSVSCGGGGGCSSVNLPPPPAGGSCVVTVHFTDGSSIFHTVDWGAVHDGACCTSYDHVPKMDVDTQPADAGTD